MPLTLSIRVPRLVLHRGASNGAGSRLEELLGSVERPSRLDVESTLLQELRNQGADLDEPRNVTHSLACQTVVDARDISRELSEHGFTTVVEDAPGLMGLIIHANAYIVLTDDYIKDSDEVFDEIADRFEGVHYTGMHASHVPFREVAAA